MGAGSSGSTGEAVIQAVFIFSGTTGTPWSNLLSCPLPRSASKWSSSLEVEASRWIAMLWSADWTKEVWSVPPTVAGWVSFTNVEAAAGAEELGWATCKENRTLEGKVQCPLTIFQKCNCAFPPSKVSVPVEFSTHNFPFVAISAVMSPVEFSKRPTSVVPNYPFKGSWKRIIGKFLRKARPYEVPSVSKVL